MQPVRDVRRASRLVDNAAIQTGGGVAQESPILTGQRGGSLLGHESYLLWSVTAPMSASRQSGLVNSIAFGRFALRQWAFATGIISS
jgi:hypothetical protein